MLWALTIFLLRKDEYRFWNKALVLMYAGCLEFAVYIVLGMDLLFWHKII